MILAINGNGSPLPRCACGEPLHYSSPAIRRMIDEVVEKYGPTIIVERGGHRYRVQRHYIALHGIAAVDLAELAKRGIIQELTKENP